MIRNVFFQYDSSNDLITKKLSMMSDGRIVWGGDETSKKPRNIETKPRTKDIFLTDRYSFSLIASKEFNKLKNDKLSNFISNFYNDAFFMDQNACSSPQSIIWLNDNKNAAKNLFWKKLKNLLVKYELDAASEIDKHTNLCKILATSKNIKKVEIENTKLFKIKIEKIDNKIFEMRGFFGCFVEYDTNNLNDIAFLSNNIV